MTQQHLSLSAAIREAATHGGKIARSSSTSYHVYGPYDPTDPDGMSTEVTADSYPKAVRIRTGMRALVALHLMGRLDDESASEVEFLLHYSPYAAHDLRSVVRAAAQRYVGDTTTA